MTTWTEQTKTGVTEVEEGLDVNTSGDGLLVNSSGDRLIVTNSKTLSGVTWTDQSKS